MAQDAATRQQLRSVFSHTCLLHADSSYVTERLLLPDFGGRDFERRVPFLAGRLEVPVTIPAVIRHVVETARRKHQNKLRGVRPESTDPIVELVRDALTGILPHIEPRVVREDDLFLSPQRRDHGVPGVTSPPWFWGMCTRCGGRLLEAVECSDDDLLTGCSLWQPVLRAPDKNPNPEPHYHCICMSCLATWLDDGKTMKRLTGREVEQTMGYEARGRRLLRFRHHWEQLRWELAVVFGVTRRVCLRCEGRFAADDPTPEDRVRGREAHWNISSPYCPDCRKTGKNERRARTREVLLRRRHGTENASKILEREAILHGRKAVPTKVSWDNADRQERRRAER